uniref:Putative secreted protein n=1 Tax=Lutzomyia longipalpis TaxID=7200 RepID=A0A7G3AMG0_LUTLO
MISFTFGLVVFMVVSVSINLIQQQNHNEWALCRNSRGNFQLTIIVYCVPCTKMGNILWRVKNILLAIHAMRFSVASENHIEWRIAVSKIANVQ